MDVILSKASNQVVTFAIRSGISLASGFAIKTVTKFLDKIPESDKRRIINTKNKIQTKIEIISTSIELIKLANARGNTSLEATVRLIDELNEDITIFDETVDNIMNSMNNGNEKDSIKSVETYMKGLLEKIDDIVPLINLSLVTSGVNLTGNLSNSVSPGRLLQASNFLTQSNLKFKGDRDTITQVGPVFDLKYYTIFYNPSRLKYIEESQEIDELSCISWKEEYARCLGRILRSFDADIDYFYTLKINEDFDDGRYHDDEEIPRLSTYKIDKVERMFFTASGKLLKLENRNSPVLILKLIGERNEEVWIALGEIEPGEFDDSTSEDENEEEKRNDDEIERNKDKTDNTYNTLSVLEYIIRLCRAQHNEKKSVLDITDEKLSLYLEHKSNNDESLPVNLNRIEKSEKSEKLKNNLTLNSNMNRLHNLKLEE